MTAWSTAMAIVLMTSGLSVGAGLAEDGATFGGSAAACRSSGADDRSAGARTGAFDGLARRGGGGTILTPAESCGGPRSIVLAQRSTPSLAASPEQTPAAAPAPPALRLIGSNTIGARLILDVVEAYLSDGGYEADDWARGDSDSEKILTGRKEGQPDLSVLVEAVGSSEAFKALAERRADVGMSSRPANEKDVAGIEEATGVDILDGDKEHVLALDGLAIIVNADNPVSSLTLEQIADVFAGTVTDWSALGGTAGPIAVYARDDKSGTYSTFRDLVLGKRALVESAQRFESSTSLSNAVSSDPDGIGFISLAYVKNAKALTLASACGINYTPSEFSVQTEDYALARRLYLYTGESDPKVASLVEFALSPAAGSAIREDGFVPLDPAVGSADYTASRLLDVWRAAPGAPSDRYNEMLIAYGMSVRNAARLSATFRYAKGSAQLDARGVRDIDRVIDFAASPAGQGLTLNFIGFTDEDGNINKNIKLAGQRAASVADTIRARAAERGTPVAIDRVLGVGPVARVTCDASEEEKQKNRRVEIWLTKR